MLNWEKIFSVAFKDTASRKPKDIANIIAKVEQIKEGIAVLDADRAKVQRTYAEELGKLSKSEEYIQGDCPHWSQTSREIDYKKLKLGILIRTFSIQQVVVFNPLEGKVL